MPTPKGEIRKKRKPSLVKPKKVLRTGTLEIQRNASEISSTETAWSEYFLRSLKSLSVKVVVHREPAEDLFTVYIQPGDEKTEYGIYDRERETYLKFPDAHLNVRVREERSLTAS